MRWREWMGRVEADLCLAGAGYVSRLPNLSGGPEISTIFSPTFATICAQAL